MRRGLVPALWGVLAGAAVPLGAEAQTSPGWSLYSGYTTSFTIPYVSAPVFGGTGAVLRVAATIGGQATVLQVDTGSQGIVIPQSLLGYLPAGTPGTISYSSSGNSATGVWATLPVTFPGSSNGSGQVATAVVPVFVEATANGESCATANNSCYLMMGIGYGRPDTGWTNYPAPLSSNPLLNLQGMSDQTVRAGYIVTKDGIQAGLTSSNAGAGYAFIQLLPTTDAHGYANWQTPTGTVVVSYAGSTTTSSLPVLVDTGITYLWGSLGGVAAASCTYHGQAFSCAQDGTSVSVSIGPGSYIGYSYTVGASDNNSAAPPVSRVGDIGGLNTGITPLAQFNLLFDAVGGFAGFQATAPGTAGTAFTPYLFTAGTLALPTNFLTNLPIYVMSATTVTEAGSASLSGAVSGTGNLILAGPGSVSFASTLTLPAGVAVTGGNASFLGNVTAPLAIAAGASADSWATLTGTVTNAGTFLNNGSVVGNVTNSGTLVSVGSITGTVGNSGTLSNTGTITGTVTNAGQFSNDGQVVGNVVNTGTLTGGGTITGTLTNDGTVAPGHSVGRLTVLGDVALRSGAVYEAELGARGVSDLITATGTIALDNATLLIKPAASYEPHLGAYQILSAGGGVSGTFRVSAPAFGTLSALYPFLAATTTATGSGLTLNMVRSAVPFAAAGATANERATGGGLDSLPAQSAVFDALLGLNAAAAAAAYDLLSGEAYASVQSILLDQAFYVRDGVLGRLRQAFDAPGANGVDAAQAVTLVPGLPLTLWAEAYGGWGQATANGNAAGDSRSIGGFLIGLDAPLSNDWRAGLAGGFSQSRFDTGARASSGTSDNYDLALYLGGRLAAPGPGSLMLRLGAAYGWHDLAMARTVAFSGFAEALSSGYAAATAQAFAELGYGLDLGVTPVGAARLEPFAGLSYTRVSTDAVTETGGAAALSIASGALDSTATQLGLRAATLLPTGPGGATLDLHGLAGWQHGFGSGLPVVSAQFAAGSLPFAVAGAPIAADSLLVGVGLDAVAGERFRFGVSYLGQIASNTQDNALKGTLSVRF
ncbi:autotransporter outer membrane beta-barrel domain-containing protein [Azorhizobium doebereinerae]|uniref:autotransporter outer membrane beta-barrel domain-containing protein n=1 Tax=Azorhizobium doebereinerae TaxID=281091 RepID=UPI0004274D56|nr:autotransporter domain-containing protein [Azorhizobium doebereinerae]